ncbi:hypothetical protein B9Y72_07235 [Stenotrophomonas maltophilia]|jgi:hypothetical protein|nr:hypothetical protein B9Y68_07235 [Stenotrophomonas maltophilia]PJL21622.1 hypothetical protein B9Y72_07235 [Stenotrophomonas maltophilia]
MKAKLAARVLAGLLMSTGASAAECGSAVAEYVYSGNPALHARIQPLTMPGTGSTLGVTLEDRSRGFKAWFIADKGSGSYSSLVYVDDFTQPSWHQPDPDAPRAIRDMPIFGWDQSLHVKEDLRNLKSAPQFLFVPDLAEVVSHGIEQPFPLTQGIFNRISCR